MLANVRDFRVTLDQRDPIRRQLLPVLRHFEHLRTLRFGLHLSREVAALLGVLTVL